MHSAAKCSMSGGPCASTQMDAVWEMSRGITSSCVSIEKWYHYDREMWWDSLHD